ncbi:carbohydrate ABC transporter substrate-binding protein (CUT1 family) [Promicromonospora sp. AC04]|uniref:ABC transporter substrate-binding protein n=1 Tax=Promicromonospora sp. AC04 TaxID=2135723 RepID=UPI000D3B7F5D|nr:ABC transporter substrate-binding protein [Promicromonospora sp. AC04]PUB25994.1 carbohydrate ABC transporter substrate-binding protein (CUT1 family) [Promicromonospora sp. AC04]
MSHAFRARSTRHRVVVAAAAVPLLVLAGCSSSGGDTGTTEITFLTTNDAPNPEVADALVEAFEAEHPDVSVSVEIRPGGAEGDNLIKTRLSTGEMADVFFYNSGSLLQALNPDSTLVNLSDEEWVGSLTEEFVPVVSTDNGTYGAPLGASFAGGIVYNKPLYEELGLTVPETWDDFMANNERIAAEGDGVAPVIQTYGETWTSQLFVLGDFANVTAVDPEWAEQYTAHQRFYADEPALLGFQHQQEVAEAGFFNEDFPSATFPDGARMVAEGEGVHYPMLSNVIQTILQNTPDAVDDIGFFALPATDAENTQATIWQPNAVYIPKSTEGAELEAAKEFVAFVNSEAGCDIQNELLPPAGPYAGTCEVLDSAPPLLDDIQAYFDAGKTANALEFISPVKGPNLEQATVEVGSQIRSAEDAAAFYDQDVEKQAKQLGLEGW